MKGPPPRTNETKSVAELSAWLSDFGEKNKEHFDNGVQYKNARLSKIQQRVKKFESLGVSSSFSSSGTDGSGTPVASSPGSYATKRAPPNVPVFRDCAPPNAPVFRDFGSSHAGTTPPRPPPMPRLNSSSSSSVGLDRVHRLATADDEFRVVSITKLLQAPLSRRTRSDSLLSWNGSDDDPTPFWTDSVWSSTHAETNDLNEANKANTNEWSDGSRQTFCGRNKSKGLVSFDEQSSEPHRISKLALLRCRSLPRTDRPNAPSHATMASTHSETPVETLEGIHNGFFPSTDAFLSGQAAAYHANTKNRVVGASKIWSEHERAFQLPSLDDTASMVEVFDELEAEWSQGSVIPRPKPLPPKRTVHNQPIPASRFQGNVATMGSLASSSRQGSMSSSQVFPSFDMADTPTTPPVVPKLHRVASLVPPGMGSRNPRKGLVSQRQEQIAKLQAASRAPQFATKSKWQREANGAFRKHYVVVTKNPGQETPPSPL